MKSKTAAQTRSNAPAARGPASSNVPAVRKATAGAVGQALDYGQAAGAGMENARREDFAIPFFQILQKLSPQLDKKDGAYIEGAESGMILNTATGEVFDGQEGILVVPCFYKHVHVAWTAREKGGGFRGEYELDDPITRTLVKDDRGRLFIPQTDIHLMETFVYGALVVGDGGVPTAGTFTMASTQLKKAKKLNTTMREFQAQEEREHQMRGGYPIFAHAYRFTTTGESNDKGNWDGWVITHEGLLHEVIKGEQGATAFSDAMSFHRSIASGERTIRADGGAPGEEGSIEGHSSRM